MFSFESFADFSDVSKRFNYLYMDMDNYKSCKLGMACMGQHLLGERSIHYLIIYWCFDAYNLVIGLRVIAM